MAKTYPTLREVLRPLLRQNRRVITGGDEIALETFYLVVSAAEGLDRSVETIDADIGMQLWDPVKKTPYGWVIPNPLREEED